MKHLSSLKTTAASRSRANWRSKDQQAHGAVLSCIFRARVCLVCTSRVILQLEVHIANGVPVPCQQADPPGLNRYVPGLLTAWHLHGCAAISRPGSSRPLCQRSRASSRRKLFHPVHTGRERSKVDSPQHRVIYRAPPRQLWPTPVAGLRDGQSRSG